METAKLQSSRSRHRKPDDDRSQWTSGSQALSSEEQAQIDSAMRTGRSRRRRYFNDKLLRDMAGPLTHADMQALFSPVPFGEPAHISYIQRASELPFWDTFRSIDLEKQKKILQVLEARYGQQASTSGRANTQGAGSHQGSAAAALRAWGRIGRRERHALKRASFLAVHVLEVNLMQERMQAEGGEVQFEVADAFERLLMHALAQYHNFASHGRTAPDGSTRLIVVQAGALDDNSWREVSCADVLHALESMPQGGLTPSSLRAFLACESDAGSQRRPSFEIEPR
ncbi:hypothetical protein WJX73_002961 [Symbiochloris irregularis]|uniref:R3H-associated N-terminal domain-containing protein n=1 Tax=Symbiochloris irregularis TaxID=706552 RepID=A0AAW1NZG2_9CHLO